ncbi:sensor histidine kinase [Saccharicrinis sp. FJH62]|uniref:sensor histidine kinase n=1 Tax=Saccharicrinis sp. FJH62 TaxID=3344657 RepID=UPI0035D4B343
MTFAPAKYNSVNAFLSQNITLENINKIKDLLNSLSYVVFILNENREIVYANESFLNDLNITEETLSKGIKPGEALSCIHHTEGPDGCGTSLYCKYCNLLSVILDVAVTKLPAVKETRITTKKNGVDEQLDLEISASALDIDGSELIVISAKDITDKKRKELLERTFFHDIINLAGSLEGIMETLEEMDDFNRKKFIQSAKRISSSLLEEIVSQQELVKAENNELSVNPEPFVMHELLADSVEKISHHDVAKGKDIIFTPPFDDEGIITDKVIFNRVMLNMLKNALEASQDGDKITLNIFKKRNNFMIEVHNGTVIPEKAQSQIFQRSFSTKGSGRGVGTYSMKLLGERYLKGKIGFTSAEKKGTTFSFEIPQILTA